MKSPREVVCQVWIAASSRYFERKESAPASHQAYLFHNWKCEEKDIFDNHGWTEDEFWTAGFVRPEEKQLGG